MLPETDSSSRRILVIDDNRSIHDDFRKILTPKVRTDPALAATEAALFGLPSESERRPTFHIDFAFQGEEGLELVRQSLLDNRPYAMAFIDVRMPPGWDGIETIARIWKEDSDLQIVVCTAYSDYSLDEILHRLGESERFVILKKPFDNVEVLQLACSLTQKWQLLQDAQEKTEELERRVCERTSQLQASNESLQNEMMQRSQVEETLRQAQKMEAIGQLAGGIAHDFNNLLTVIRCHTCCLLEEENPDSKAYESLQQVDGAAERAASLTRQLLTFSRKQVMQLEDLNLNETIGEIAKMLHRLLGDDIVLEITAAPELPCVSCDRAALEQVILNLAVNSRDAMPTGGRLSIRTVDVELDSGDVQNDDPARRGRFACIVVTDSGAGIAPEVVPHLFEPFFTTKEIGKGTGLGLATVYAIIKQHSGWIEVESAAGCGATFKIFLPAKAEMAKAHPAPDPVPKSVGGHETILLVEDEPILRALTRKVLQRYGYRLYTAGSGLEALKVWSQHAAEIDLLLTDMIMPQGLSGRDLAQKLQADRPDLKTLYSSGYTLELLSGKSVLPQAAKFLPKPYTPDQLAKAVRECLASAAALVTTV